MDRQHLSQRYPLAPGQRGVARSHRRSPQPAIAVAGVTPCRRSYHSHHH